MCQGTIWMEGGESITGWKSEVSGGERKKYSGKRGETWTGEKLKEE